MYNNKFYKIIKINHKNYLFFSDLHIFHKNIFRYENKKRNIINKLLKLDINDPNYWVLFYTNYSKIIETARIKYNISKVFNLGDYIFFPNETKLEKIKNLFINYDVFILGNHDIKEYNNKKLAKNGLSFDKVNTNYKNYLGKDETDFYKIIKDGNKIYIISHHPIINTAGIYKFYWKELNSFLKEIAFKEYKKGYKIINIHGHTHSKKADNTLEYINYINVSLDNLV